MSFECEVSWDSLCLHKVVVMDHLVGESWFRVLSVGSAWLASVAAAWNKMDPTKMPAQVSARSTSQSRAEGEAMEGCTDGLTWERLSKS